MRIFLSTVDFVLGCMANIFDKVNNKPLRLFLAFITYYGIILLVEYIVSFFENKEVNNYEFIIAAVFAFIFWIVHIVEGKLK